MSENNKSNKPRTVSTARLERMRTSKSLTVVSMCNAFKEISLANPNLNLQECLTEWANQNGRSSTGGSKSDDPRRAKITSIAKTLPYGGEVKRIQSARNEDDKYIATVELESGAKSKMWFSFTDTNVSWGIGGSPAQLGSEPIAANVASPNPVEMSESSNSEEFLEADTAETAVEGVTEEADEFDL